MASELPRVAQVGLVTEAGKRPLTSFLGKSWSEAMKTWRLLSVVMSLAFIAFYW